MKVFRQLPDSQGSRLFCHDFIINIAMTHRNEFVLELRTLKTLNL